MSVSHSRLPIYLSIYNSYIHASVHVCVCVCVCMNAHMHKHTQTHQHTLRHVNTHKHTGTRTAKGASGRRWISGAPSVQVLKPPPQRTCKRLLFTPKKRGGEREKEREREVSLTMNQAMIWYSPSNLQKQAKPRAKNSIPAKDGFQVHPGFARVPAYAGDLVGKRLSLQSLQQGIAKPCSNSTQN